MPNGGFHEERVGVCPQCHSPRIGVRRRRHRNMLWRCRNCNRVFATPEIRIVKGEDRPNAVMEESIPQLESRARRNSGGRRGPISGCLLAPILAIAVVGVVGIAVYWLSSSGQGSPTPPKAASQSAPSAGEVSSPMPTPRPEIAAISPTSTLEPSPTLGPTRSPAATPGPSPNLTAPPNLRHSQEKLYMLELINQARALAGTPPVELGDNNAAQLHAESSLENCFSSHWGIDGLKPYMRYTLAGGYQSNGENASGLDYCITWSDGYRTLSSIETEIRETMEGWMSSPGHRRNILDRWHKKVNIGLAWDRFNFSAIQHFEGDYVEYDLLPEITKGKLSFSGHTKNGARFADKRDLGIQIFYDPTPHTLTRGQVSRTYCYGSGFQIASLRHRLPGGQLWTEEKFTTTYSPCPDPYDVSPDAPGPGSSDEAHEAWQAAYHASKAQIERPITVPWLTASEWTAHGTAFSVEAEIGGLVKQEREWRLHRCAMGRNQRRG